MKTVDVIIAGGGIIGLSTAMELALSGLSVTVLERGAAMSEASWAAAGMLAAHDPENPASLRALAALSLALYPAFLDRIEALSGVRIPLLTRRTLQGTRAGASFARDPAQTGLPVDSATAAELCSGLNTRDREFLLLEEASLDPRDLCNALPRAARAAGVQLLEHDAVETLTPTPGGTEVCSQHGNFRTGAFVNCCGAWAGSLPGSLGGFSAEQLGVEPRKGQLVLVDAGSVQTLKIVLRTPEIYLVPRGDGRIVIGATTHRSGFNKQVDSHVVDELFEQACDLWPPLSAARVVDSWTGLRPGTADGLPLIGSCGEDSLWIAAGHFRNGILLAPATARVMSQLLRKEQHGVPLKFFAPQRFALAEG